MVLTLTKGGLNMKKVLLVVLSLAFIASACTKKVAVISFSEVYPGMKCVELEKYLGEHKIPFKHDGKVYKFVLEGTTWEKGEVTCDGEISLMAFESKAGATPKHAEAYIDAQQSLLGQFRDSMITYEEGNKTINFNNGLRLHQFMDDKSGVVTGFKISVTNADGTKAVWEEVVPILPKIGAKK